MAINGESRPITALRRAPILEVCREEPQSRREIAASTDASRTTVYRATKELESEGLLEGVDGGYRTTPKGAALSRVTETYRRGTETIDRLEPLFEIVDDPDVLEKAHLLADATMTVADEDNMYRANDRVLDLWADSETVRAAMMNTGSRLCLQKSTELTREGDMDVELCFHPETLPTNEHLANGEFDASALPECFDVSVTDAVSFTFVLYDEVAAIVGHDEVGTPIVVAETECPLVYGWLEDCYTDILERSRPVRQITD